MSPSYFIQSLSWYCKSIMGSAFFSGKALENAFLNLFPRKSTRQWQELAHSDKFLVMHHCIVLYLYIYIALLAVHTNQKPFQCERPREKFLENEKRDHMTLLTEEPVLGWRKFKKLGWSTLNQSFLPNFPLLSSATFHSHQPSYEKSQCCAYENERNHYNYSRIWC